MGFQRGEWFRVCSFNKGTRSEPTALGLGFWVFCFGFWVLGFGFLFLFFVFLFFVLVFGSGFAETLPLVEKEPPARSLQGYLADKKTPTP